MGFGASAFGIKVNDDEGTPSIELVKRNWIASSTPWGVSYIKGVNEVALNKEKRENHDFISQDKWAEVAEGIKFRREGRVILTSSANHVKVKMHKCSLFSSELSINTHYGSKQSCTEQRGM